MGLNRSDGPVFQELALHGWRQFADVSLRFHPRLTVITGANAAGKTSLLTLLSSHFGWQVQFVGTPERRRREGALSFLSGLWRRRLGAKSREEIEVGHIAYSDGHICSLRVPELTGSAAFGVNYGEQRSVSGLFIPSHRPTFVYQQVTQIPTAPPVRQAMFDQYLNEFRSLYAGGHSGYSPAYRLKEALISLAVFGEGNGTVESNPEALELYRGFVSVLREVLPSTLGFRSLSIRMPEVVLETESGDFAFDAISGGVASIIDLAFQIFMRGQDLESFVVVIDEPENHLHPELQRTLLPGFLAAFPNAQFIVATHNPFIVGSVSDSHVYVLRHHEVNGYDRTAPVGQLGSRVSSVLLDTANKAGSSNDILREVLGVPGTRAIWVERHMSEILGKYEHRVFDETALRELFRDFASLGMEDVFPREARRLLDRDQTQ